MFKGERGVKWVKFGDLTLSDWTKDRLRYRPLPDELVIDLGDTGRTIAYNTYRRALLMTGNSDLIVKYDLDVGAKDVLYFRSLSEYFKKRGPQVEPKWRMLVDLHRLSDYLPYPETKDFIDDIQDWVQRSPVHTWNGNEEEWYTRFERSVRKVLFSRGNKPRKRRSIDWFCKNSDIWCTAGSGFEPEAEKLEVFDKQRQAVEKVKKNKWSVRWAMSTGKIKRLLTKRRKQISKAVAKSEPGKVRAVVSSDLGLYLKMSYVSLFLDQILQGREDSTLWMNEKQRLELWQRMEIDGTWRMPIDQSEFDKNVTKRQVLIALNVIKELLIAYDADQETMTIMDEIIYAVDGGLVFVGGKSFEYKNGVLSGWRWTAMLDTIVNLSELDMAQDWVRENSKIVVDLKGYNAQGDDDWIKVKTRREAIALWLAYESFGLFVNPGKFFLAKDRDEYLRRVMEKNVITGYPARSITSICFRSPLSDREGVGGERIRSVFGRWKLFAERLGVYFEDSQLWKMMISDMKAGLRGSSRQLLNNFCNLGAAYGGIGVTRSYIESPIPGTTVPEPHPMDVLGEGFNEWSEFAQDYGVSRRAANNFAVSTLDLAGSFGVPDWVKVIFSPYEFQTKVPVKKFVGNLEPGCVFVGAPYRFYAIKFKKRFFSTLGDLKGLTQFSEFEWMMPDYKYLQIEKMNMSVKAKRPEVVSTITNTMGRLSDDLEKCYDLVGHAEMLQHKPKSWVKDFVTGALKARNSIKAGWGVDAVGGYANLFLNDAIVKFLNRRRPNLGYWDSLLASVDVTVSNYLDTLRVRVVE